MKTYTHADLVALSQETGRSLDEIKELARNSGWELAEAPHKLRGLDSAKDAITMMKQVRERTIARLYENDPLIRESLNAQAAVEDARKSHAVSKPSNNLYDANGNFTGVNKSIMSGPNATGKNQAEAMKAIRANIYKRLGVEDAQ